MNIGINGCALDTGNLGVSALALSTIYQIAKELPEANFHIFDNTDQLRTRNLTIGEKSVRYRNIPLTFGKRLHRISNVKQLRLANAIGLKSHPVLKLIKSLDIVLDISGGDSFTDLYGPARTETVMGSKEFFLSLGIPLLLLPQTVGPFLTTRTEKRAAELLKKCFSIWSRDKAGAVIARDLLPGNKADSVHEGLDMAFALPTTLPSPDVVQQLDSLSKSPGQLFGLNVSGLLYNQTGKARSQFGFIDDYPEIIQKIALEFLSIEDSKLVLVPHVVPPCHDYEADVDAQESLAGSLVARFPNRVHLLDGNLNATEIKWAISNFDHFCGTRMHSCIAAISQGVPTTAIAYSDKTAGVFESVGCAPYVIDPRIHKSQICANMLRKNIQKSATEGADFAAEKAERSQRLKYQMSQICSQIEKASKKHG